MKNKRGTEITIKEIVYLSIAVLILLAVILYLWLGGIDATYGAINRIFSGFNLSHPPTEETQRPGYNLETQQIEYYDGLKWNIINSETINFRDKSLSTQQLKNEIIQKYFTRALPAKFELEDYNNKKFSPQLIYKKEYYIINFDKESQGRAIVLLTRSREEQKTTEEADIGRATSEDTNMENLLFDVFEINYLIVDDTKRVHLETINNKYLKEIRKVGYSTKYIQQKITKDGVYRILVYEILFDSQPTGIFIDIYKNAAQQIEQETLSADIRVVNIRPQSSIENYLYAIDQQFSISIRKTDIKETDINKPEIISKNKPIFANPNSFQKFANLDAPEQEIISKVSEWRNSILSTPIQITYTNKETKEEESQFYCLQSKSPYLFIDLTEIKTQNDKC